MKTTNLCEVWNHRLFDRMTIGVNWSAVGVVTPDTARRFAKQLLKAADKADKKLEVARQNGYEIRNPETGKVTK